MTESTFEQARRTALDPDGSEEARSVAIGKLANVLNRDAAVALLQLASRPGEPDRILRSAGAALAELMAAGLVSEWDARDLTPPAADAFLS